MEGLAPYRRAVQTLQFGDNHPALRAGRIATIQTLGGSGALKVGADFLKRYFPDSAVWVSDPTWENHVAIFAGAGFEVHTYPSVRQRHPRGEFTRYARRPPAAAAAQHCAASPLLP